MPGPGRPAGRSRIGRPGDARSSARPSEAGLQETQLERTLGWCALELGETAAARAHFEASLGIARGLSASFEVATTLRSRQALLDPDDPLVAAEATESGTILAGLGVVDVPLPRSAEGPAPLRS